MIQYAPFLKVKKKQVSGLKRSLTAQNDLYTSHGQNWSTTT